MAHAELREDGWWIVPDETDNPPRLLPISDGPYKTEEEADANIPAWERGNNTGGFNDAPTRPSRPERTPGDQ